MPFKNPVLLTKFKYEKKNFWCGKSHFHAEPTVSICVLNFFAWFGGSCEPGDTVSLQIMMVMGMGWSHRTSQLGRLDKISLSLISLVSFNSAWAFPHGTLRDTKGRDWISGEKNQIILLPDPPTFLLWTEHNPKCERSHLWLMTNKWTRFNFLMQSKSIFPSENISIFPSMHGCWYAEFSPMEMSLIVFQTYTRDKKKTVSNTWKHCGSCWKEETKITLFYF